LLADIRRANLDAVWARSEGTVRSNLLKMKRLLWAGQDRYGRALLLPSMLLRGPLPVEFSWGIQVACAMLSRSLEPGNNSKTVQFSNKFRQRFTQGPTGSLFFERFVQGCHARMGHVVVRDRAPAFDVLEGLLQILEGDLSQPNLPEEYRYVVILLGALVTLGFSMGLRGEEMALCQLNLTQEELLASAAHRKRPHVMVVLRGRFKVSRVRREHCLALAPVSASGVQSDLALQVLRGTRVSRHKALRASGGAHPNCSAGQTVAPLFGGVAGGHARAHWAPTGGGQRVQLPAFYPPRVDHVRKESRHGEQCD
jgi:hypothetical protein